MRLKAAFLVSIYSLKPRSDKTAVAAVSIHQIAAPWLAAAFTSSSVEMNSVLQHGRGQLKESFKEQSSLTGICWILELERLKLIWLQGQQKRFSLKHPNKWHCGF